MSGDHGEEVKFEVRLHGLGSQETMLGVNTFFSSFVNVLGVRLHQLPDGRQWAQVWVKSQEEVDSCLGKGSHFAQAEITIEQAQPPSSRSTPSVIPASSIRWPELSSSSRPPSSVGPAGPAHWPAHARPSFAPRLPRPRPDTLPYHRQSDEQIDRYEALLHAPESSLPWLARDKAGLKGGYVAGGPLPRNLYVVDLPLDMSEIEFRNMFEEYGSVEHCKLLSQLDGMGRRRGFILMSDHREAVEAMKRTDGLVIDRCKMDVSWALVQREAKQFVPSYGAMPNRVIHPPHAPSFRSAASDSSLLVEGLDNTVFTSSSAIRDLFSTFGKVLEVQIIDRTPATVSAMLRYEHVQSAQVLASSDGMPVGNSTISVKLLSDLSTSRHLAHDRMLGPMSAVSRRNDDPFAFGIDHLRPHQVNPFPLKANSQPFIPGHGLTASTNVPSFSLPPGFTTPSTKPISIRRGSLDVSIGKINLDSSSEDEQLASSVEKLLLSGHQQERVEPGSNSPPKNFSDGSQSATPPSSPHPADEAASSGHGSDSDKKSNSTDAESGTVVGEGETALSPAKGDTVVDRWSAGNPAAQWVSSAWSDSQEWHHPSRTPYSFTRSNLKPQD